MELSWQDAFQQFQAAGNEQRLFEQIASFAKRLGFDYCCYGIRVPLPVSSCMFNPVRATLRSRG